MSLLLAATVIIWDIWFGIIWLKKLYVWSAQ